MSCSFFWYCFIVALPMRKCSGQHSYISSTVITAFCTEWNVLFRSPSDDFILVGKWYSIKHYNDNIKYYIYLSF